MKSFVPLIFTSLAVASPAADFAGTFILELTVDGDRIKGIGKRAAFGETAVVELTRKAQ